MKSKTWTYEEITKKTEKKIKENMKISKKHKNNKEIEISVRERREAFGYYLLWAELTAGFWKEGDEDRLFKLTQDY